LRLEEIADRIRKRCDRNCVIVVSGVPGTGKSTVTARLAEILGWEKIDLSEVAIRHGLILQEDKERRTYVIDEDALRAWIRRKASNTPLVIDSHYGEIVDDDLLLKLFVLRVHPKVLTERLLRRGWHPRKVAENVEAELLGVCTVNALEEHPREKVCEIDATNKTPNKVVEEILRILAGEGECVIGIDWLSDPASVEAVLSTLSKLENLGKPDEQRA